MGACQSCLGRRDGDVVEEDEEHGLLYDESHGLQYGSFGDTSINGELDTVEVQRENEALQKVVAKTSNNMVDIFEIVPRDPSGPSLSHLLDTGAGSRLARSQRLVSKLSADRNSPPSDIKVDYAQVDSHNGTARPKSPERDGDALVGTFADAAAASGNS